MKKFPRLIIVVIGLIAMNAFGAESSFSGKWVDGEGDVEKLALIEDAFETIAPSSRMVNINFLYKRDWDGLYEGMDWYAYWGQNSFGSEYGLMPFLEEPYATWIKNSHGLHLRTMGDGKLKDSLGIIKPDGALTDATLFQLTGDNDLGFGSLNRVNNTIQTGELLNVGTWSKQGDGGAGGDYHFGSFAAQMIMELERLLVSRDKDNIREVLPQFERTVDMFNTRLDRERNLVKTGRASVLLAPVLHLPADENGESTLAYVPEINANFAAALVRMAELYEIIGDKENADKHRAAVKRLKKGLESLRDDSGSFIMYEDEDGIQHGVFGAEKHGYYEAAPNHDSVATGLMSDADSKVIMSKMLSIPQLRPYKFILPNYPGYDEEGYVGNLAYGGWVNGGHWGTTQGRANIAFLRVDEYDYPFEAWGRQSKLFKSFKVGTPMPQMGKDVEYNHSPYIMIWDGWGSPAGILRGLFEYRYTADGIKLRPHLPKGIINYTQKKAFVFGKTKVYLRVSGEGDVSKVTANGRRVNVKDGWVVLASLDANKKENVSVEIVRGKAQARGEYKVPKERPLEIPADDSPIWDLGEFADKYHVDMKHLGRFYKAMVAEGYGDSYECIMARTALQVFFSRDERIKGLAEGSIETPVDEYGAILPPIQDAVTVAYLQNARFIAGGLADRFNGMSIRSSPGYASEGIAKDIAKHAALHFDNRVFFGDELKVDPEIKALAEKHGIIPPIRTEPRIAELPLPLTVGSDRVGEELLKDTKLASLRFYNRVLNAEEIKQLSISKADASNLSVKPTMELVFGNQIDGVITDPVAGATAKIVGDVEIAEAGGVKCADFKGGYILGGIKTGLHINKPMSFDMWINIGDKASGTLMSKFEHTSGGANGYYFNLDNGLRTFIRWYPKNFTIPPILRDSFIHLAVVSDNQQSPDLYINGELCDFDPAPLVFGAMQGGQGGGFGGDMATVRIYDKALDADAASALAQTKPGATDLLHKPMVEFLPGETKDGVCIDTVEGRKAYAVKDLKVMEEDGVKFIKTDRSGLVVNEQTPIDPAKDYAIEVWVRNKQAGVGGRIVDKATGGILLDYESGGIRFMANNKHYRETPWTKPANEWIHLIAVHENGAATVYIDGRKAENLKKL